MVVCPPCAPDGDFELVDENLVLGYAVFVDQSDIELLASKHSSITHPVSCNLLVRNGNAPVYFLPKSRVNVSLGINDKSISDYEDSFMEMKIIYHLYC